MQWIEPRYLFLLSLLPVYWCGEMYLLFWRRKARVRFAEQAFHETLFPEANGWHRLLKSVLWSLAFTFLVLALARPQGQPVVTEKIKLNRINYLVLDCSLSMQAQDNLPSRLQAAKETIRALIALRPDDRLGLIAVAAEAEIVCPATNDHPVLLAALESLGTHTIAKKGSSPMQGIQLALKKLTANPEKAKTIILFSDGEENSALGLETIGTAAASQEIPIAAVGMGTENGSAIPIGKDFWGKPQYRIYQGRLVKSRHIALGMQKAAVQSRGRYYPWETSFQTAKKISSFLEQGGGGSRNKIKVLVYFEYFPWLVGLAFCCLWLDWIWPVRRRRSAC